MSSDLVRFSVAMPALLLDEFDRYTAQRGLLVNRSEAIRNLIRDALVNEELEDSPELLNSDPYGAWIFKVTDVSAFSELLDAEAYEAFTKEEH